MKRKVLFCSFEEREEKRNCERIKMKIRYLNKCHSEEELIITVQIACKSLTYNKTRKKVHLQGQYHIKEITQLIKRQISIAINAP